MSSKFGESAAGSSWFTVQNSFPWEGGLLQGITEIVTTESSCPSQNVGGKPVEVILKLFVEFMAPVFKIISDPFPETDVPIKLLSSLFLNWYSKFNWEFEIVISTESPSQTILEWFNNKAKSGTALTVTGILSNKISSQLPGGIFKALIFSVVEFVIRPLVRIIVPPVPRTELPLGVTSSSRKIW